MKYIMLLFLFTSSALAEECNLNLSLEEFKTAAANNLDKQTPMSSEAAEGFNTALEVFWAFRSEIKADNSMCTDKFHVYDHISTLLGFNQNAFTRFPPDTLVARNTIGPGLGIDHSFLELGATNPEKFASALKGILVYFELDKEEANGPGRALKELNYDSSSENIFNEISVQVCKTEDPINCYNLALYRLITFDLAVKPEKYLKKGSALDFAKLLVERGEIDIAQALLNESENYESYYNLYISQNPNFDESMFEVGQSLQ